MVNEYHCVAVGVYLVLSKAIKQIHEYSGQRFAGYDDIDDAPKFMKANGDQNEDNTSVFDTNEEM